MGIVENPHFEYEGKHKILIRNFGDDVNQTVMELTSEKYNLLKRVEYEMSKTRYGYCPSFVVEDHTQIALDKKRADEEKKAAQRRKRELDILNNGQMAMAMRKAGIKF